VLRSGGNGLLLDEPTNDLDDVVGPDGEEEPIERGVMQLAGRDAVC
jgi:hypothetical protein